MAPAHQGEQRTDDRGSRLLNIEQQNKEPQNDEVITLIFPPERIRYSAVQKGWSSDEVNLDWFSRGFWLLAIWALAI
jgi:hypothetical protein